MDLTSTSWLELNTTNPENAIAFYGETLGWDFESTDLPKGGTYWIARLNDKPVGGLFGLSDDEAEEIPSHWMTYMKVSDMSAAHDSAREAGCQVIRPPLHLDGVGKLSVITDQAGALIGLIEPQIQ